jgi:hypothetical protein
VALAAATATTTATAAKLFQKVAQRLALAGLQQREAPLVVPVSVVRRNLVPHDLQHLRSAEQTSVA